MISWAFISRGIGFPPRENQFASDTPYTSLHLVKEQIDHDDLISWVMQLYIIYQYYQES